MAKIILKEALKQASVVDELKNFVGLTKDDAVGLMTPERLAAVAGGLRFKGTMEETDDLNNINISSSYLVNGKIPKNYPNGAYPYGAIITEVVGNITAQIAFTHSNSESYIRVKYKGSEPEWKEWCKITSVKVSL